MRGGSFRNMWVTTTPCACTAPSATSPRPTCSPGDKLKSMRHEIGNWKRRVSSGRHAGSRWRESRATMIVPGKTEAGSAGMQPCRGIAWRAHRDDVHERGSSPYALVPRRIGSVDPDALKIPARRAEYSLTENPPFPFHAEPAHCGVQAFLIRWWQIAGTVHICFFVSICQTMQSPRHCLNKFSQESPHTVERRIPPSITASS